MLNTRARRMAGFSLIEVLITLVILAFGVLGLANLQGKMQIAGMEAYQRAQAVILLEDISGRISANNANAAAYVTGPGAPAGTGDTRPASCTGLAAGAGRDLCEWSNALKGAGEKQASSNVGAMIGARGCVQQTQAPNTTPGICTPAVYRVTVTWQGLNETEAPDLACAAGLYGDDSLRRAISSVITIGLPSCN